MASFSPFASFCLDSLPYLKEQGSMSVDAHLDFANGNHVGLAVKPHLAQWKFPPKVSKLAFFNSTAHFFCYKPESIYIYVK